MTDFDLSSQKRKLIVNTIITGIVGEKCDVISLKNKTENGKIPTFSKCPKTYEFCLKLERAIYKHSFKENVCFCLYTYREKINKIIEACFVLKHDILNFDPDILSTITDRDLYRNTSTGEMFEQLDNHEIRFKDMLNQKFADVEKNSKGKGLLQCSSCKSTNVIWSQKQTRSADEGMTISARCLKCDKQWIA